MADTDKILLEIPRAKGNGEVLRATAGVFKGSLTFGLRVWYRTDDGSLAPGRNGINLPRSEWAEFKRAVDAVEQEMTLTSSSPT
jgi:hypothetical protein